MSAVEIDASDGHLVVRLRRLSQVASTFTIRIDGWCRALLLLLLLLILMMLMMIVVVLERHCRALTDGERRLELHALQHHFADLDGRRRQRALTNTATATAAAAVTTRAGG